MEGALKFFQMMFKNGPLVFGFQMENYFTNGILGGFPGALVDSRRSKGHTDNHCINTPAERTPDR